MSIPEYSDEEVQTRVRQLLVTASQRVAMVAFSRGEDPSPDSVDNNGTASFIHLPDRQVIVTNHHVWDHFNFERASDPTYRMVLTGTGITRPYDISAATLISTNQDLDLCVLGFPPEWILELGKQFCSITPFPPQRLQVEDYALIVGFPGMRRTVEENVLPETGESIEMLRHESWLLSPQVEAVSSRQARLAFRNSTPEIINMSGRNAPSQFRWGGMSGSLVYRLDTESNRFEPAGILSGGGNGFDEPLYVTHLDYIGPNGIIETGS